MAGDRRLPRAGALFAAGLVAATCAGPAAAQDAGAAPLSAIDWLSRSLVEPAARQRPPAADLSDGAAPSPVRDGRATDGSTHSSATDAGS